MRVNLTAQSSRPITPEMPTVPLSLMIRPSCGLPGDYLYNTNSTALLRMLRDSTELPTSVLDRFKGDLRISTTVRLSGVELSDRVLTEIGYFID